MKKLFDGNKYRAEQFQTIDDPNLTNEERRKLEMDLLRPEVLPAYGGKEPSPTNMRPTRNRMVQIPLRSDEDFELVEQCLGLRHAPEGYYIKDVGKLITALEETCFEKDS